jgi:hypothetical protein
MISVYAIHKPFADKLSEVIAQMQMLGTPTIKVVDCGDYFMALEGSHRLAAASILGLTPNFVVYEQDDNLDISGYDWFEPQNWENTVYAAGEIAGEIFSNRDAVTYRFDL